MGSLKDSLKGVVHRGMVEVLYYTETNIEGIYIYISF